MLRLVDRTPVAHLVSDSLLDDAAAGPQRNLRFRTRSRDLEVHVDVQRCDGGLRAQLRLEPQRRYVVRVAYSGAEPGEQRTSDACGHVVLSGLRCGLISFHVSDASTGCRIRRTGWALY